MAIPKLTKRYRAIIRAAGQSLVPLHYIDTNKSVRHCMQLAEIWVNQADMQCRAYITVHNRFADLAIGYEWPMIEQAEE